MLGLEITRRPLRARTAPLYLYRGLALQLERVAPAYVGRVPPRSNVRGAPGQKAGPRAINQCGTRPTYITRRLGAAALMAALFLVASPRAQDAPLPETRQFLSQVRAHLRADRDIQSEYTYIERREELRMSKLGAVTEGPVKVYEVYPSLEPGGTYKRLIAVNGVPLSPSELAKADRKHRMDLTRERERRRLETPDERARRLKKEAEEQRQRTAVLDEIFEAYHIRLVRREMLDGHPTILTTLEPKISHRPRTDEGRMMKKLRARVWVSEADYQIARAEVDVIEDVTVGWGFIGRLHKGTRGIFERRKINNEVWLPSRETLIGTGRALLFRTFQVNTVTEYSGYRRVSPAERERLTVH
jgi:hypothetical protein